MVFVLLSRLVVSEEYTTPRAVNKLKTTRGV